MSYPTPAAPLFLTQLKTLCESENQTPLCQRYFWKLVGLVAFDELSSILGLGHPDSFAGELGELSSTSGPRRVREGFPSDSYARVNGTAGVASDEVRRTLSLLASAPWRATGNEIGGRSSRPTAHQMAQLESKRRDLVAQTAHAGAMTVMTKAAGDPSWGDLWDAFTLAAVGYAEALQGRSS